jgi:hypothetical protein
MLTAVADQGGERRTCFVVMPVTTPAPYADDLRDPDHFGHVLAHLFAPALEQAGYDVIPPKALGAALIHAEIIRHLEQADLVLADLSAHNANVFFELGIRTSLDRPVVLVRDARTATIPFDLGTINVLTYDESLPPWKLEEEVKRLAEHVGSVPADGDSGNDMWRYFGLTRRGDPAQAGGVEAKVDLLLAEVTRLRLLPAAPRRPAAPMSMGLTELVRENWEEILARVKKRSRVAWILLNAATVESVGRNSLTLGFSRKGEANGFTSSGHDDVLVEVLDEAFGIRPTIFAITRSSGDDSASDEPPF